MALLLVALGAMRGVDLFKEALPWPPAAWVRSLVALALAIPLALLTGRRGQELVLLAGGAWGLSAVLHEVVSVLGMLSDDCKQRILFRAATRRH